MRGVLFGGYVPEIHRGIVKDGGEARGRLRLAHQGAGDLHPDDMDLSLGTPGDLASLIVRYFLDAGADLGGGMFLTGS